MEAFSDGVIAILITVMVLELHIPEGTHWHDLHGEAPVLLTYVLSFAYLAIYWNNHHHMLKATRRVNGPVLWANMHLLFWLSLIPFTTGWMGQNNFNKVTVALYAALLTLCGIAYYILLKTIQGSHPHNTSLLIPLKKQSRKGTISVIAYIAAIPL